jgi:endonuclease/exonuclease/phosphatase family metal-dependent hydrolase
VAQRDTAGGSFLSNGIERLITHSVDTLTRHIMAGTGKNKVWRYARRTVLAIALIVISTLGWYGANRLLAPHRAVRVFDLAKESAPQPEPFSGRLRLATFNIAHGRGTNESNFSDRTERHSRLEKIAALLKEEQVDIAVLQEVDFDAAWTGHEDEAKIIARSAGFPYVMEQRNFDVAFPFYRFRCGNAVLSHRKIVGGHSVPLPVHSRWEQRLAGAKQGSWVDIQLAKDVSIRIFVVHLEWRDEATRIRCTEPILAQAKRSTAPFFCMGDFNSTPTNFPFAETESGVTLVELLRRHPGFQTRPENPPAEDQLTWPSFAPAKLIDWILVPMDWRILGYHIRNTDLSDHAAVFMEVSRP